MCAAVAIMAATLAGAGAASLVLVPDGSSSGLDRIRLGAPLNQSVNSIDNAYLSSSRTR